MIQSQNKAIKAYLESGNKLTSLEAWVKFGCSALHSRISDLRNKMNVAVNDKWVTVKTSNGDKRVKQYYIDKAA